MNITSQSLESLIMRNMKNFDGDPHFKKLLAELEALKEEMHGPKKIKEVEPKAEATVVRQPVITKQKKVKKRHTIGDGTFRCSLPKIFIKRTSHRLSGKVPKYDLMDDIDEFENTRLYSNGVLKKSTVIKPRTTTFRFQPNTTKRVILTPEEITEDMLNNISSKMADKIYDAGNGSCCHQCRQKTRDTKTICRNLECVGLRGQFCGPCALNRYGESVADALLDPYWSCFVCREICNCSFCRSKNGKIPTGILAPIAKREGHESVKDFLEDNFKERIDDPESVLGFISQDKVMLLGAVEQSLGECDGILKAALLNEIIEDFRYYFRGFETDKAA